MNVQLYNTNVKSFIRAVYPKAQKLKKLTDNPSYQFTRWMDVQNRADDFGLKHPLLEKNSSYIPICFFSEKLFLGEEEPFFGDDEEVEKEN